LNEIRYSNPYLYKDLRMDLMKHNTIERNANLTKKYVY